jgi:hypothetical protein
LPLLNLEGREKMLKTPKTKDNKVILKFVALFLTIAMAFTMCFDFFSFEKPIGNDTVYADDMPPKTVTQAINDADAYISFEFNNGNSVNSENYKEYVFIRTMKNETPDYRFFGGDCGEFSILAPTTGYTPGVTYIMSLNKGVKFKDESYITDGKFYFTVMRDEIVNVNVKENVKIAEGTPYVEFVNTDTVIVYGIDAAKYNTSDIMVVTTESLEMGQVSLIIDEIVSRGPDYLQFKYSYPSSGDVVVDSDVYFHKSIELSEANFDSDWMESVKESVAQLSYVQDMHEVVNTIYNAEVKQSSTMPGWINVIPVIKVRAKSWSPIDILVEIIWSTNTIKSWSAFNEAGDGLFNSEKEKLQAQINAADNALNNSQGKLEVKIELEFKKEMKVFVSEKNGVRNASTIETSSTSAKVTVGGGFDIKVLGEISKKYRQIKYKKQESEWANDVQEQLIEAKKPLENVPNMKNMNKLNGTAKNTQTHNANVDKILAIQARNAKTLNAREFINANGFPPEQIKEDVFTIRTPAIALAPFITLSFELQFFLDIQISAEIGTQHIWKTTIESGTLEHNGETENYHNEIKEYTGNIFINGKVDIRVGVRGKAYFSFAGVIQVGIKAEAVLYVTAAGSFAMAWGNGYVNGEYNPDLGYDNPIYDAKPWIGTVDVGFILSLTAYVKVPILSPFEFTFFQMKNSFIPEDIPIVQKYIYDLTTKEPNDALTTYEAVDLNDELPKIIMNQDGYGVIPKLYKTVYDINLAQSVSFNNALKMGSDYVFGAAENVYFKDGMVFLKDSSIVEFEEVVYAYLIVNGEVDENTFLPFIINKLPVKVDAIEVNIDARGVEVGGSISLNAGFRPQNASYKNVEYFVEYVETSGVVFTGMAATSRAWISDNGLLTASKTLEIDDVVGVKALAIADNVYSNVFEIPLIKTPVKEVVLLTDGNRVDIKPGGELPLYAIVSPVNATNKNLTLAIVQGSEYVDISDVGLVITALPNAPMNALIKIVAMADGVSSAVRTVTVGAIPIESVKILNANDGQELSRSSATNVCLASMFQLDVVAFPSNATANEPHYKITAGAANAVVSDTGELRIGANAAVGAIVKIIANISGVNSPEYNFVVERVPVEQVSLNSYQNKAEVMQGDKLQLYSTVFPNNATYLSVVYAVTQGLDYALVSPLGVLSVYGNASIGAVIKAIAICEGVVSNEINVTVLKRPVQSVSLKAGGITTVNEGGSVSLSPHILPSSASNKAVLYNFIEGGDIAYVDEFGVLSVSNNVCSLGRVVKVQAVVDDVYSNILTFAIFVPIRSVGISLNSGRTELQKGEFERLTTIINPEYATNSLVVYEITNNPQYVTLDNTFGVLSINYDAPVGGVVGIVAIVEGVRSSELFITILKIPVECVEVQSAVVSIGQGKSYQLSAVAYPAQATYRDVSYIAMSGTEFCEIDTDINVLSIHDNAPIGSVIRIAAIADGVESEEIIITVIAVAVSYLRIIADKTTLLPGEWLTFTHEINADASNKQATYRIVSGSEYASVTTDGILMVYEVIPVVDAQVRVIANVDGVDSNAITLNIYVPISFLFLTADKQSVVTGGCFTVTENVNDNATDKIVSISIQSGGEYIARVNGGTYSLIENITVPNAKVVLIAAAQGLTSEPIEIKVVVPVESVSIEVSDIVPKQGEVVTFTASYAPVYATNDGIRYSLKQKISEVSLDSETGVLTIGYSVAEGTLIKVEATCGGISGFSADVIVQRIPAESVIITSTTKELKQGSSLQLTAVVSPEYTTYPTLRFDIIEGEIFATITDSGLLTVNQNAAVNTTIKVIATALSDNITSVEHEITVLKVPVEYVHISTNGVQSLWPGETLSFVHEISENSTYNEVIYAISEGGEYATVTADGLLTINDIVNARFAVVKIFGSADGVISNYCEINIYNPAKSIAVCLDKATVRCGQMFTLTSTVSEFATSQDVSYTIDFGSQFATDLGDGVYLVNDDITVPNARITISGHIDKIHSESVTVSVYIETDSITITEYPAIIEPNTNVCLSVAIAPIFATNKSATYYLKELVFGVELDLFEGMLSVSSGVPHNTQIQVYAVTSDNVVSETIIITVRVSDITISVSDLVVRQSDYLRIFESFEHSSFEAVYYVVTPVSHSESTFATVIIEGVDDPKVYLDIDEVVTVRNYSFSVQAFADNLSSNVLYFNVYIPVTQAVLSADNYAPISTADMADVVVLSVDANETATNQTPQYEVISGAEYVATIDIDTGVLTIKTGIDVPNAEIAIGAVIDGYACEYIILKIIVPVTQVALSVADGYVETHKIQQGSCLSLSAKAYPSYATNGHISYIVSIGGEYCSVDQNGFVTIYRDALVGADIQIVAVADGVSSVPYSVTTLKVPVTKLSIYPAIAQDLKPGDSVQFFGIVNSGEYATYGEIRYFIESGDYATITESGMLIVNATVDNRFAKVHVYAEADGYRSEWYEISIYNTATAVTLTSDKTHIVRPGEIITFTATVDTYATVQDVRYVVPFGENYITNSVNGKYKIKEHSDIRLPNASFAIYARHVDGIDSDYLLFSVVIDVESIELTNNESTVVQGNTQTLSGIFTPAYATSASIVYALRSAVLGVTIDSNSGVVAVEGNVPVGEIITAYAKAVVNGAVVDESEDVSFAVAPVAVTSVTLSIPSNMTLGAGSSISFVPTVLPTVAATKDYNGVLYFISNKDLVSVINNTLTVSTFTEEMVGQTINIYAIAGGTPSLTHTITLSHTSVSVVTLTAQNNVKTIAPGESAKFYASISPSTATVQTPKFSIVSGVSLGYLEDDILKTYSDAKHNSKIIVEAYADGKYATYEITIRALPISISVAKTTLIPGEQIQIKGINDVLFTNVSYIATGYSSVSSSGLVIVNNVVSVRNAQFIVTVTADDLPSKQLTFTVYIPISSMTLKANGTSENAEASLGSTIELTTVTNPNATNQTATYSVESGWNYGVLSGGTFTLNASTIDLNPTVTLKATINDNGTSKTAKIIVKIVVPVTNVTATVTSLDVNPNKSYVVLATVEPINATYKTLKFTLHGAAVMTATTANSVTFKVNSEAESNGKITVSVASASYTVNGIGNAGISAPVQIFTIKRILVASLEISSVKNSTNKIIDNVTNANKARPGDTLTPTISIAPADASSGDYTLSLNSTAYAYVSDKTIIVRDISQMTSVNPSFLVTVTANDEDGKTATLTVVVYVPVMSLTNKVTTVERNSSANLGVTYNNDLNGGYATVKTFMGTVTSVTNVSVSINNSSAYCFNGMNLVIPKNAPSGTVIKIKLASIDDITKNHLGSVTVNPLNLSASDIYYNTNTAAYSSSSVDSAGRTMYTSDSAQLEEGKYTYVLGKYNSALIAEFGVTYTVVQDSSYATLSDKKLMINSGSPGTETVTLTITFKDGTKSTTVNKKIKIFNAISGANLNTSTITDIKSYISSTPNDSLASNSSNSYSFIAITSNSNYSLTTAGCFTLKNKAANHTTINDVSVTYKQKYNGTQITVGTWTMPLFIDFKSVNTVVFHKNKDDVDIDDSVIYWDDYMSMELKLSSLKTIGYTKLTFTINVDMREINDGYQEIYLYSGKGYCIWQKTNIEHGSADWGTRRYTVTIDITAVFASDTSYYGSICLGYGANGALEDTWRRGQASVTVTAS